MATFDPLTFPCNAPSPGHNVSADSRTLPDSESPDCIKKPASVLIAGEGGETCCNCICQFPPMFTLAPVTSAFGLPPPPQALNRVKLDKASAIIPTHTGLPTRLISEIFS